MVRSVTLFVAGVVLLVAALAVDSNLNAKDARQADIDRAVGDFNAGLTGRYEYRKSEKASRLPVYFLAGGGVLAVGLGVVCLPRK
jgi:hypothetical protein